MNKTLGAVALSGAAVLAFAPSASAAAVACDTPARQAVYKTVVTPATPDIFKSVKVVDVVAVPGTPGTPAVYEDVKVIDVAYQPPTPGTPPVQEVSHIEHRLVTPGTPEVKEVSHPEYKYKKSVSDYKTENKYMYRKYVKGNVETKKNGSWKVTGSFGYELYSPSNGWSGELHHEGAWGNESATDGTGPHNSTSKVVNNTRKHSTTYQYQRAELLGTRQVKTGEHTEYYKNGDWTTDKPGAPWVKYDERKFVDVEYKPAVPPVYEDVKVIDVAYKPGTPGTPAVEEVSHTEHRLVTPATPGTPEVKEVSHVVKTLVLPGHPASKSNVLVSKATKAGEKCESPARRLAHTGSEAQKGGLLGGGMILAAALAYALRRRFTA